MRISGATPVEPTEVAAPPTWAFWTLLVVAVAPALVAVDLAARAMTASAGVLAPTSAPWSEERPTFADRATAAVDAANPDLVLVTTFLLLTLSLAALVPRLRPSVPAAARWVLTCLAAAATAVSSAACAALLWTVTRDPTPLESPASGYSVTRLPTEGVGHVVSGALWTSATLVGVVTLVVLLRSRGSGGPPGPDGRTVGG